MLRLEQFSQSYPRKTMFTNAQFIAERGQITLLHGESGIGKSTLLDILAGLTPIASGSYQYDHQHIEQQNDQQMSQFRNQHIGYIVQDCALLEDYTVLENLLLPALYSQEYSREAIEEKAQHLAHRFGVVDLLSQKVAAISGGQKQRIALIRSLVLNPDILLADEPTAHLDKDNSQLMMAVFEEWKALQKIVIIATHDERLDAIADTIYQIRDNQIVKQTANL